MKRSLVLIAVFVSSLALASAQDEADVKKAETDWAKAVVANDYDMLEGILADDLYYSHSNFLVDTKRSYIDALKSGKARYYAIDADSTSVQVLDARTALAMTIAVYETKTPDGSRQKATLKTLHVFRKNGSRWQLTAHQSARKPE
jgi:ketosteroid isomerase-like protein